MQPDMQRPRNLFYALQNAMQTTQGIGQKGLNHVQLPREQVAISTKFENLPPVL
jgi:hypothetical protein